jgi:hypothetical protein
MAASIEIVQRWRVTRAVHHAFSFNHLVGDPGDLGRTSAPRSAIIAPKAIGEMRKSSPGKGG